MATSLKHAVYQLKSGMWIPALKVFVVLGLAWFVYDKLWFQQESTGYLSHLVQVWNNGKPVFLISCLLLAPLNWFVEISKWKKLTRPFHTLSWKQASESILAGITLGLLTPSRLGEYGGRLLHVDAQFRAQTLFAHFMGSLAQNIPVFIFGGLCSLFFFSNHYFSNTTMSLGLSGIAWFFAGMLVILFSQNKVLLHWLGGIKLIRRFTHKTTQWRYVKETLHEVAMLSVLRYLIFAGQYILLLYFFDIDVSLAEAITGVGVIFMFQSGLPLPPALSVFARTQLALIVWSVYDKDQISMLAVPLVLWLLNLLLPALAGGWVILSSNLNKESSHG
ncbi:MAG: flippase-like domain-containing protein [Saprospiraceae bacterium]|nr:flippase-like domain-containing protein [Saprospiraceae bacterium]